MSEVNERLVRAWKAEVEAVLTYQILVEREKDEKRKAILKKMCDNEKTHRERIEARMTELGFDLPKEDVSLSAWKRVQARTAPVEKILMAQEAAEEDGIELYTKPTGDAATDKMLQALTADEKEHSLAIASLRSNGKPESIPVELRLNKLLTREKWHRAGTGWVSGAIYGANDGLAAVFGIVSGVSGATGGSKLVLTAGLAGAVASSLSMATGAFLAERSAQEITHANIEHERKEIHDNPAEEKEELSLFYQLKGVDPKRADELAEEIAQDPELMLKALTTEELGSSRGESHPAQAALAAGLSTAVGAIIPCIPFFFAHGLTAIILAAAVSLIAHFLVGAAKALVTLRTWWAAGLEMTLAGVIVGGVTYALGLLFHNIS